MSRAAARAPVSGGATVVGVRCPWCEGADDRVVDSREVDEHAAIRRRRECLACGRRFTTYGRASDVVLWVKKRSGSRELFHRAKVAAGALAACKNRPVTGDQIDELTSQVEDVARRFGPEVPSEQIGLAVLERLRALDDVASVRFASVYKGFEEVGDFARELGLLQQEAPPAQ